MNEMLNQYKLFEEQVQKEYIPRWIKARLNGLNKQLEITIKHIKNGDKVI